MKKIIFADVIVLCFHSTFLFAAASENETMETTYADGTVYSLHGCFSQICTIQVRANERALFHSSVRWINGGLFMDTYYFRGRTGEKTFALEYRRYSSVERNAPAERDQTVYYVFFSANDTLRLHTVRGYGQCTYEDYVYLKMIELKGNVLKYQIQLPECAKKY